MFVPLPESARVLVPTELAKQLLEGAQRLPAYDNKDFYDTSLQARVLEGIREVCSDGIDWLEEQIRSRLAQSPYCALVSGLKFDEGNRVFVGVNRIFGDLVARPYEKPRAQLVHYIQPSTDRPAANGHRYESENLHTDTADWSTPVELISMVCVRQDADGGGRSRILDVDTLRSEVQRQLGDDTLALLESESVPWELAPYRGGGVGWRPVISPTHICWRRYTIDLAMKSSDVTLSDEMLSALNAFGDVVASAVGTLEFLMEQDELLFTDNHRTIHARTPISSGAKSNRLMIRSWIRTQESA